MNRWLSRLPTLTLWIGGLAALFGTYWDNAWHTDFGRDEFFTPPHLVLYGGVTLGGAAAALWALFMFLRTRRIRTVVTYPPLALALLGTIATLLSAPIDDIWHVAFGRDAVLWSPPHLLGITALFALGVGVFLETNRLPGQMGLVFSIGTAVLVLGAAVVPVMEYEADVPQFARLWYLPVLAAGTTLAFAIARTNVRFPWMATAAALIYTLLRIGIAGTLATLGHSFAFVPPIIAPAIAFDLLARTRLAVPLRAALYTLAVYLVYVLYLDSMPIGLNIWLNDILIGVPVAAAVSWLVLVLFSAPQIRLPFARGATLVFFAVILLMPAPAFAHDPGQGEEVGQARLVAIQSGSLLTLDIELIARSTSGCNQFQPAALVARRADQALRVPLSKHADCVFSGAITVPEPGRWFVYAELTYAGTIAETWLPVVVGATGDRMEKISSIYLQPARTNSGAWIQAISSVVLYLVDGFFVGAAIIACRRALVVPVSGQQPEP